jgi:hypothetical protein
MSAFAANMFVELSVMAVDCALRFSGAGILSLVCTLNHSAMLHTQPQVAWLLCGSVHSHCYSLLNPLMISLVSVPV